jgi:hypothetical protein
VRQWSTTIRELVPIDPLDPKRFAVGKPAKKSNRDGSSQLVERERNHIEPYRSAIADSATHNYEPPPVFVRSTAASLMMDRWADAHYVACAQSGKCYWHYGGSRAFGRFHDYRLITGIRSSAEDSA